MTPVPALLLALAWGLVIVFFASRRNNNINATGLRPSSDHYKIEDERRETDTYERPIRRSGTVCC